MIGNKGCTETADRIAVVEERSCQRRSFPERVGGAAGSEYVGLSNDKRGENPRRRKPKVSWGR
jgi:hypothetical protein